MKKIILSTLLSSLLLVGGLQASESVSKTMTVKEANKLTVTKAQKDTKKEQKELIKEAIDSLKYADEALLALEKKDEDTAKKKIESALGKLEVILASKKVPELLAIDSIVEVNEYIGTSKEIEKVLNIVKELLNDNKVQEARALLLPLQSEIAVTTTSLPLASYPDALKLVAKYLQTNEVDKAKEVLEIALNTFVSVTEIIPIPLLKATDLIARAEVIAKKDKKRALSYLDAASESLKVSNKLGYVSKSLMSYKILEEKIELTRDEIKGPNKAEKLFENLKNSLKEFKEKVFAEKTK